MEVTLHLLHNDAQFLSADEGLKRRGSQEPFLLLWTLLTCPPTSSAGHLLGNKLSRINLSYTITFLVLYSRKIELLEPVIKISPSPAPPASELAPGDYMWLTFLFSLSLAASFGWLKRNILVLPKSITAPKNTQKSNEFMVSILVSWRHHNMKFYSWKATSSELY